MIVGVDVGNTAVKIATHQGDSLPHVESIPVASPRWLAHTVRTILLAAEGATEVRIASVAHTVSAALQKALDESTPRSVSVRMLTYRDVPLDIQTDAPERVGIDRLLSAWGASRRYASPLMVVDAGTTVTIDFVDAGGIYRGGAILPGLEMQTRALAAGTAALPQLDWKSDECRGGGPLMGPGRNTLQAIRLGILSSVAGAITRLHNLYLNPPTIVMTGGDAECLATAITNLPMEVQPQLVARAILELP